MNKTFNFRFPCADPRADLQQVVWSATACDDDDDAKLFELSLKKRRRTWLRLCLRASSSKVEKMKMMKAKGRIVTEEWNAMAESKCFEVSLGSIGENDDGVVSEVQLCQVAKHPCRVSFDLVNEFPWRMAAAVPTTTREPFPRSKMERSSDVTVRTRGQKSIKCHKFILALRSPVFAAMLERDMAEKASREIDIVDFEDATVEAMVDHMYGVALDDEATGSVGLLLIADKYDVQELRRACEIGLSHAIDGNNAAETWIAASRCNADELKKCVVAFLVDRVKKAAEKEKSLTALLPQLMEGVRFLMEISVQEDVRDDFLSHLRNGVREDELSEEDAWWTELLLLFAELLFLRRQLMGDVLAFVHTKVEPFAIVDLDNLLVKEEGIKEEEEEEEGRVDR